MSSLYKPGTDNLPSGTYKEVGPRRDEIPNPRKVRIEEGDRLPPTQEKGRKWEKHHPIKFICNQASAYIFPFSPYFVI
jgi:hypothetical protein